MKVVVIGAGIVGASAAYHLALGGEEVVIIDKNHQGAATGAGAGIVCPWISRVENNDWFELAKRGAIYYPELIQALKEDGEEEVGYKFVGALGVGTDSKDLDKIEERAIKCKKEIPEVGKITRLSSKEAKKLFPPLREDLMAVHVTGAARVDGRLLREALKKGAIKHGASVINGEVTELIIKEGKIVGVEVGNEYVTADKVIFAGGAWVPDLLGKYGINIQVEPQKGQIVHIKMENQDTSEWPVILPQTSHYLVSFDDRVVVGATRETGSGFDYRVTIEGVKEVVDQALSVAPGLGDGTLSEIRIGFRPMGDQIIPFLGEVTSIKDLVIATGLGASGLTMGPYVGKLAAEIVTNVRLNLDITPYSPERISITSVN